MRIVLDTNVLVRANIKVQGPARDLLLKIAYGGGYYEAFAAGNQSEVEPNAGRRAGLVVAVAVTSAVVAATLDRSFGIMGKSPRRKALPVAGALNAKTS